MTRIIRLPEVMNKTGKQRSTIYLMIEHDQFPRQIKLSARSVGWLESEVDAWIEQCVTESRHPGRTP